MMHSILSKLPKPLDLDALISRSATLHKTHPPNHLLSLSWYRISSASVLKTTRDPHALAAQTLSDGERFFARHASDIKKDEVRQKQYERARVLAMRYRRPAVASCTAVLAALLALYLRRVDGFSGLGLNLNLNWAALYQTGLAAQARVLGLVERLLR